MRWRYSNIQHEPRMALKLSLNEYVILDTIYKSQTHPQYGFNGWAKISYDGLSQAIGVSKSTAMRVVERLNERGFVTVNPVNPNLKQVKALFYKYAYETDLSPQAVAEISTVPKRNAVPKRNEKRSETERNAVPKRNEKRSETERHIEYNRTKGLELKEEEKKASRQKLIGEIDNRLQALLATGRMDVVAAFAAHDLSPTIAQIHEHIAEWWGHIVENRQDVARADELRQWRHFRDNWIPYCNRAIDIRRKADNEPPRTWDENYYEEYKNDL